MTDLIDVTSLDGDASLPSGLPEDIAGRLMSYLPVHGRRILVARQSGAITGLLVALQRPTAAMLRIVWLWAGRREAGQALVVTLAEASAEAGILSWRIDAGTSGAEVGDDMRLLLGLPQRADKRGFAERWLANHDMRTTRQVPHYAQSTEFTCGPCSLAMSFGGFDPAQIPDRHIEIALWREATTVIGLTGPGGCDPYAMALAAQRRGYRTRLFMSTEEPVLLDRGNTEAKRDLMRFVQADFKAKAHASPIIIEKREFDIAEIHDAVSLGAIAIVLIDQMATHGHKAPHWVVAHSVKNDVFLINDPWIDRDSFETEADAYDLPVRLPVLDRMAWYGEPRHRAAIVLSR
ncbi:peptidase C39 family protein [Aestuariivirga sp. YIM B02566]|uniref:Peptidase C39 family protein n=1 Tax=Taklimakanibacter albus TaxID=2800327 RepID=A0ACC5R4J8_9HYPH|nr:peptidase C39 family protein [Aestuariivirga sp. YIM B02566]MBK1867586.1 peptidase C39 family protein [Aestuariivirga sp. YIM B02566]